ncbi:MAG: glycosyltransferase [Bacteroidia bacterium]|nr:glycosyltransferase [Bacteroidota bacterium]MBK8874872.1 glycosyltransferase [Bacteroidota bacterium]MBK9425633.1 glycosyltransferase [Bacteroidota bacterium]MBP9081888.1 glycosyltransferase [Bacteroidia bacterium]
MRVLLITSSFPTTFDPIAGNFVESQIEGLRKRGVQVDVVALNIFSFRKVVKWMLFRLKYSGLTGNKCFFNASFINIFPFGAWFHQFWFRFMTQIAVEKYMKRYGVPDLIHAHFGLWAGYSASQCGLVDKVPLLITEHSSIYYENNLSKVEIRSAKLAFNRACRIIVPSSFLKEVIAKQMPFTCEKLTVIPNFVNSLFFNATHDQQRENVLISIGRLVADKGFETVIKSFAKMKNRKNYNLIIVGDGTNYKALKKLSLECEVYDNVHFTGILNSQEISNLLKKSKILVSCSHFETFGMTIVESLATGTPVLVTNVGAPKGFVSTKVGEVCKVKDVEDTSSKLDYMIDNYSKYDHASIREFALSHFGEEVVLNNIFNEYKSLVI